MLKNILAAVLLVLLPAAASAAQKPNIVFLICDDLGYGDIHCLQADPGETNNLYLEKPERLLAQLEKDISGGRSTLGAASEHDVDEIVLWKTTAKQVSTQPKAKRPNILFIIADDQSPFDLKTYNSSSTLDTPVIDRLAAEGLVFDGAYHMGSFSGAVCSPSRHMIMTGRTVWHLGGRRTANRSERQRQAAVKGKLADNSMAAIFNRAGYDTMRTCKKGNSFAGANAKFTVVHDATKRGGTAESGSEWHADQVLNYLEQRDTTKDEDPFLIYLGFSHPHDPRTGPDDLLKKYAAVNHKDKDNPPLLNSKSPALPTNYLPGHPFPDGHPNLRDEVSVSGVWKRRDEATIRNEIGRQYACSDNIDIQIDRVLKKLADMGELDNTYVIYTADHGMAIGRHGLQGKQNLYEHTWRVPFIVKGPGVKPGRVQGNIYLLDVLGTMCDLANVEPPDSLESKSFLPIIEGKKKTTRDVLYGVYCGGTKPGMRSVRKGDWKLIKYDALDGEVRETQLFNLKENPHEYLQQHHAADVIKLTGAKPEPHQVDLAEDPKYAAKLAEMEALLLAEMKRLDDPYRLWNQPAE
jgi:arylsulfatase A-like enzyme